MPAWKEVHDHGCPVDEDDPLKEVAGGEEWVFLSLVASLGPVGELTSSLVNSFGGNISYTWSIA